MVLVLLVGCGDDDGPACVAGSTQACVGPGGCAGGQACLPDGSGFGECDCGADAGADAAVDASTDASSDASFDASLDVSIDAPDATADAAADADGGPDPDECDPLANSGCGPGEKCTWSRDEELGVEGRTTCVPDGAVAVGEPCETVGEAGSYTDDCAGGAFCLGECATICNDADDMCPDGTHCATFGRVFMDRPDIGMCIFSCDVLSQNCDVGEACYLAPETGEASCVPPAAEVGSQGDVCEFINACEPGYGCIFDDGTGAPTQCAYHCDADDAGGPTCDDGPGAAFTCISLHTFYSGVPDSIPTRSGMCVDCSGVLAGTRGCP